MNDKDIIELYFARNEDAIAETAKKYSAYCKAVAENILKNPPDEEECLNDTWLSAWNSIPPEKPNVLKAYLGRITRNLSLNMLRRRKADKRSGFCEVLGELTESVPDGGHSVENALDGKELAAAINDFLKTLSQRELYFFMRRYWYCDSLDKISAQSGVPKSKISSELFRIRARLKKHLLKEKYT